MVADTLLLRNPTTLIPRPTRRRCQSPPTSVRSVLPSGSNRRNPGRGGPLKGVEMDLARRMGSGCFSGRRARPLVEENSGGVDVMAAAAGVNGEGSPEHLVVMVNGIIGSKADWRYAAEQFVRRLPNKVIVHCSECNTSKLTFDGVDMMGERLANEILAVVKRWPQVQKISIVAHSLGGLIARYAIAKLYRPIPKSDLVGPQRSSITDHDNIMQYPDPLYESRIAGLEPINFITFATPHLGSKGNNQLPILCGLPFLEKRASQTAHLVAGRTGKHLFLSDGKDGKPPLLLQMVKDSDDLQFISALRAFKRRVAYANANYDHMVGWRTSSIRRQDELPKSNLLVVDQKYPHVVFVQRETAEGNKGSAVNQEPIGDLEEEMINGLTQVAWERVDVSFRKSRQRYVAHTTIQVKTYWLNSDGADVVSHMIDNFLL